MSNATTLKDAFVSPKKKKNGGKNAQWYHKQKALLLAELATNESEVVRMAIAVNTHTPAGLLTGMLEVEQDIEVLRCVMLNPNMSRKAVAEFVGDDSDPRVEAFDGDTELFEHFATTAS